MTRKLMLEARAAIVAAALSWLLSWPAIAACGDGSGAQCWWIGGGGNANWNTSGNWSNTEGGASSGTTPATGDNICFSGTANNNSTLNTAFSVTAMDTGGCGGAGGTYTGTLTHASSVTLTVSGNDAAATGGVTFRLGSGTTYTLGSATSSALSFTSTSGTSTVTANSSGAARNLGNATFNGAGGTWQLGSVATVGATATTTLTAGTLNANSNNLSTGLLSSSNSNTRQLTLGASTLTLTGVGVVMDFSTMTNFGANCCNSATVVLSANSAASQVLSFGAAATIGTLSIGANASGGFVQVTGPSSATLTLGNLAATAPRVVHFSGASARMYAITNGFALVGSSGSYIGLFGSTGVTFPTISSANAMTCEWCAIGQLTFAGGGNLTGTRSFDMGGVTISGGGTKSITAPTSGGGGGSACLEC
ncbi:MAG: hypothetical protein IT537_03240 [Hyphomicrobiales bacterium]|nr:hypothetical protein [Hyphomicrobiales bacterium]